MSLVKKYIKEHSGLLCYKKNTTVLTDVYNNIKRLSKKRAEGDSNPPPHQSQRPRIDPSAKLSATFVTAVIYFIFKYIAGKFKIWIKMTQLKKNIEKILVTTDKV